MALIQRFANKLCVNKPYHMSTSVFHFEATDVSQLLRDKQLNRGIEPRCVVSFISYALEEQPRRV